MKLGGRRSDVRIAKMPSSHGERGVMRLLDEEAGMLQVDDLGVLAATSVQLED